MAIEQQVKKASYAMELVPQRGTRAQLWIEEGWLIVKAQGGMVARATTANQVRVKFGRFWNETFHSKRCPEREAAPPDVCR